MLDKLAQGDGEVHATARCPDCGARVVKGFKGQRRFWYCERFPDCRGSLRAYPPTYEPVPHVGETTPQDRQELRQLVANLVRDERCSRQDAWNAVMGRLGHQVHPQFMSAEEFRLARSTLLELAETLPSGIQVAARAMPESCCKTVKDAYGSLTICTARMRWCLGQAEHATRPTHNEDNRGGIWGDGYTDEETLQEEAEAAFADADSRRV